MVEQNVRQNVSQTCDVTPDAGVHPRLLKRIRMIQQERSNSERSREDTAKDELISAYCTLNRAVNLLKKNEHLLAPHIHGFFPECKSLNNTLRQLLMAPNPDERDICAAKDRMSALFDSFRSINCAVIGV